MTTWPSWFPGLDLKAEHLLGLEDYLLTRISMADATGNGIEDFDWKRSVEFSQAQSRCELKVSGPLLGLTPGGMPVRLSSEDFLLFPLDGAKFGTMLLDIKIWISPGDERGRVRLNVEFVDSLVQPVKAWVDPSCLYLGRYQVDGNGLVELIQRPMMRRLSAVKPLDEPWRRWIQPFSSKLAHLNQMLQAEARSGDAQTANLLLVISQISFGWQDAYLPKLMQSLRFASWLARRRITDGHIVEDLFQPERDYLPKEVTGEDMPAQLAKMLCISPAPKHLSALLNQLLAPIYLRVPLSSFRDWEQGLWKPARSKSVEEIVASLRQRAIRGNVDPWSRAVALLTMTALRDSIGYRWPSDTLKSYSESEDKPLEVETGRVLEELYKGKAQSAPAGPAAFLCLSRVGSRLASLMGSIPMALRPYFDSLSSPTGMNQSRFDIGLSKNDRVLAHLIKRMTSTFPEPGNASTGPRLMSTRMLGTRESSARKEIRIGVVGPGCSGKTSLIQAYTSVCSGVQSSGFSTMFSPNRKPLDELDGHQGAITLKGVTFEVRLLELAPPSSSDAAAAAEFEGDSLPVLDFLIITIDPATVDVDPKLRPVELMKELGRIATKARRANPAIMIAIAYTKADEFGLMSNMWPRVVQENGQMVLLDGLNRSQKLDADRAWERFLDGVAAKGEGDKWSETRRVVLNQSRELWTSILCEANGLRPTINGYFVCADPADSYYKSAINATVGQMFNDFCGFFADLMQ